MKRGLEEIYCRFLQNSNKLAHGEFSKGADSDIVISGLIIVPNIASCLAVDNKD